MHAVAKAFSFFKDFERVDSSFNCWSMYTHVSDRCLWPFHYKMLSSLKEFIFENSKKNKTINDNVASLMRECENLLGLYCICNFTSF